MVMAKQSPNRLARTLRIGDVMPHDLDSEQMLCGCLFVVGSGSDSLRSMLAAGVTARTFYSGGTRAVFNTAEALLREGIEVDLIQVLTRMRSTGELETAGGAAAITAMAEMSPTTLHMPRLIGKLCDVERQREKMRSAWKLLDALQKGDVEAASAAELEISGAGALSAKRLPPILSWKALVESAPVAPPELVEGVLHMGSKMMLGGGSKSFKTWVLMDLALSVATGTPWWGMRTQKARTLFVNFELAPWSFEDRRKELCTAKKITDADGLAVWHLRGYAADLKDLLPVFLSQAYGGGFGLIILDPIYKCLGERDENANGEVASLLNEVEALAVRSGAAVVFGHHFSKGNQASKEAKDRVSGAGAWARDPDALITLTPHEEDEHFSVEYVLRNQKPKHSHVVRWRPPCMEIAPGLNPDEIRQPGRPKAASIEDVLNLLGPEGLAYTAWLKAAAAKGISKGTFERRHKEAQEQGRITNLMGTWKRK